MRRKGQKLQTGGPAAALIGIITILFIFYILFLPPAEREALLEGEIDDEFDEEDYQLLDEAPGRISFTEKNVFDHRLSNLYLQETRNAIVIGRENPFMLKKGWFREQTKRMLFSIPDLENTENIMLSFQAPTRKGRLLIALNGLLIFESSIAMQNPPPVILPKTLLLDSNIIEFSVDGGFFSRRQFELFDVKVVGDETDIARQIATNSFTISRTEKDNLEEAFLDFFPICDQRTVGTMTVQMNGKLVFSGAPACDGLNRQDLDKDDLREGKNMVVFQIDKGSYRVEQIRVRTTLEPVESFVDFFNLKASVFNDILDKEREAVLLIEFIDDGERKRAELNVNGKKDIIDQTDYKYERTINSWVREGNNYIEIKPLTDLNIVKLEVRVD